MSPVDFIKDKITADMFLDLIKREGARNVRLVGDVYRSTCPIHKGNNDTTFSFNPNNKLFNCFSECGGGDIFDFIALINDIDIETEFKKVVELTAQEFNIDISNLVLDDIEYNYKKETLEYLRYLNGKKEIFNSPYNLNVLGNRFALNNYRGLNKEQLIEYGVSFANDLNRVCFEIKNQNGIVVGASLRATGEEKPKWLHRPKTIKTGMLLYNLNNVLSKGFREVIVVEGIMDCLNLIILGIENVVCTFGDRITAEQKMLLIKYFDTIILGFDNDVAGMKAKTKQIERLKKIINVKILIYDKKDPGMLTKEDIGKIKIINWYEREE